MKYTEKYKRGNILIVRANYKKAYPIICSLKRANFKIICGIDDNTKLFNTEGFSKYIDNYVYIDRPRISEANYIKSIIRAVKSQGIDLIMPVGFIDFKLISKYKEEIEKYCIVPTENYNKLSMIADKWQLQDICKNLNVKYPKSFLVDEDTKKSRIRDFVERTGLPIVVKGVGDASVPTYYSDLDSLLKRFEENKKRFLLQEFITGIGVGYFVFSDKGKILAEFMHRRVFEASPLGGASIKARSNYDRELLDQGRRFVKGISWTGVMMFECKKDTETGQLYLIEVNPKFWGSLELSYKAGVDFPRYVAEYYLEGVRPKTSSYQDISFSWFITAFSSYTKFGLPTTIEAVRRTIPRNPMFTDLHMNDPINFTQKIATIAASTIRKMEKKPYLPKIYISKAFRKLRLVDINCIVSDFDGTIVKLPLDWNEVVTEANKIGLLNRKESINEGYYRLWSNKKEEFIALSNLVKRHEISAASQLRNNVELSANMKKIKDHHIKFIVVSKQSEESLILGLKKIGILNYIDEIVGRESEILRLKQVQMGVNKLFNLKKVRLKGIMIGDQLTDIKSSLQIGMVPYMITSNNIKKLQAIELGINYAEKINYIFDELINPTSNK